MSIVTGLGGAFLRADDPKALYAWYEKHLGISAGSGCFTFEAETQRAAIAVSFFPRSSDYFPVSQPAMLNFQVDDLDGLLDQLSSAGVTVDAKREEYEYGRFGWFSDPEGNRVELWQPKVLSASGGAAGDMFSLHSRVALVTGSARGIGRAIAQQLTAAGAVVMLNDLDPEPLEEARAALPGARALAGDLTDPAFPQQLVDAAIGEFGGLDIIVNNAGYTWDNIIQKTTDEQFQAMLDIHIVAPFRILRAAAPFIRDKAKKEAAGGLRVIRKVVNITSISATDGSPGQAGYGSGKAAVIGLTRTMAKEWGRYNVNVNAVGFGLIGTRLIQPLSEESKIGIKGHEIRVGVQPGVLERVISSSPLGRAGTAEEAAGAVLFFCSPLSDFVTGELLMCAGGMRF